MTATSHFGCQVGELAVLADISARDVLDLSKQVGVTRWHLPGIGYSDWDATDAYARKALHSCDVTDIEFSCTTEQAAALARELDQPALPGDCEALLDLLAEAATELRNMGADAGNPVLGRISKAVRMASAA